MDEMQQYVKKNLVAYRYTHWSLYHIDRETNRIIRSSVDRIKKYPIMLTDSCPNQKSSTLVEFDRIYAIPPAKQ